MKCFAPKGRRAKNALRIDGHGVCPKYGIRSFTFKGRLPGFVTLSIIFTTGLASAQEAIHEILNRPNPGVFQEVDNQPYTFKIKDLSVLMSTSLGFDYNDNISISQNSSQSDFILRPMLNANGIYPLTDRNVLTLNAGVGYDQYLQHSSYSGLNLSSGSGVAFDMGVGDFQINLHDRFSYSKNASGQSLIAGNGQYGQANNAVGVDVAWDLGDITLSSGYDHDNTFSPSRTAQTYQSQDHSSDVFFARSAFLINPQLTSGIEGTATFTTYDQNVLNNNKTYSAGVFANWQPGDFSLAPRVGYSIYDFQQTSSTIRTGNSDSWYADLTASYRITPVLSTSFSAGHEVRLGIQSDAVETWYLRPQLNWGIIEGGTLSGGVSYEKGKQGVGNQSGNLTETYDYYGPNLSFGYALAKNLSASLNYRLTIRSSNNASRDYTQNLVGLQLTYLFH